MSISAQIAKGLKLLVILLGCGLAAQSAMATEPSEKTTFVLGNFEFALLHELAHVIIGDNEVPILGPLESAADYTAIMMAIRGDGSATARAFLSQALVDSATSFATTWQLAQSKEVAVPYWDVHALGIQRYYAALCLIYGSDPVLHSAIGAKLPPGRATSCPGEYALAKRGFEWLLGAYAESPKAAALQVTYEYGRATSVTQQRFRTEIRRLQLLENTVGTVTALFRLSAPIRVVMRSCGQPEAAWQPEQRELVICYELLDAFAKIHQYQDALRDPSP